jgi:hypothetical protein
VVKAKPYTLNFCVALDEIFKRREMKSFEGVYEVQTMIFCCKHCVKDFKIDSLKYLTKLANAVRKQGHGNERKK